jgi:L-alanine-DL-glutamate epimerase-like enolase superfamily enzyme
MVKPCGISFFEEPITQNDVLQMREMRRATGMALACGQNEGLIFRFRDLLLHEAVDYVQPNVVSSGGFTQSAKIAGLAAGFNVPLANGGAWPYHNMHLQAGVANGGLVEMHYLAVEFCRPDLSRPAGAEGRMAHTARSAGTGLRTGSRRHSRHRKDIAGEHTLIAGGQEPRNRAIWRWPRWLLEGRTIFTGARRNWGTRTR